MRYSCKYAVIVFGIESDIYYTKVLMLGQCKMSRVPATKRRNPVERSAQCAGVRDLSDFGSGSYLI